jgi:hypothetical protein
MNSQNESLDELNNLELKKTRKTRVKFDPIFRPLNLDIKQCFTFITHPGFQKHIHRAVKKGNCILNEQTVRGKVKQSPQSFFQSAFFIKEIKEMSLEKLLKDPYGIFAASAVVGKS